MQPESVCRILAAPVARILGNCEPDYECLQEIRLRVGKPVLVRYQGQEFALCEPGRFSEEISAGYRITEAELRETLEYVSGYSLYAFDEEMRQGFLTVPGGHRVGLAGLTVMEEGSVRCIRHISSLNIRISHQMVGCADPVIPWLYEKGEVCHTLLISPPGGGKTTMLRDLIRQISDGNAYGWGRTVGVVDERSELAGSYLGIPQNDLGIRTDIMDACTKSEGMRMLLRSMAPQVIAVDELGNSEDGRAIETLFYSGCRLIATAHGASIEELSRSPLMKKLIQGQMFERYVLLLNGRRAGEIQEIQDGAGHVLFCGKRKADQPGRMPGMSEDERKLYPGRSVL